MSDSDDDLDMDRIRSASEITDALDDKLDEMSEPINIYEYGAFALDLVDLDSGQALAEINLQIDTTKFTDGDGEIDTVGKLKIKEGDKVLYKASHDRRVTVFVARDDHHLTEEARN